MFSSFKKINLIWATFIILLFLVPHSFSSQTIDLNLPVKEFRLKNGMLFLVIERHTTPQVACRLVIRAGSSQEDAGKSGVAHLIEHMMFKGTKNFGSLNYRRQLQLEQKLNAVYLSLFKEKGKRNPNPEIIKKLEDNAFKIKQSIKRLYIPQVFSSQLARNGAVSINAFTSKDQTQYYMSIPSDMIEQWFSIVSEQIFEPAWWDFFTEKEVVKREWAFRYVNNPYSYSWLNLYSLAYMAHPYKNPTIGWQSDIERLILSDAKRFHRRYYCPKNTVVVLVGDVELERVKKLARIYFERYPPGERASELITQEPPQNGERRAIRYLRGAKTPVVQMGFHGPRMGTDDFYAMDVLTMILDRRRSARLYQDIINKGLATDVWASNPDNRFGTLTVLGGVPNEPEPQTKSSKDEISKEQYIKACRGLEELLLKEIDLIKRRGVTEKELKRVKKLAKMDFIESLRRNESIASRLANLEVQIGWRYLLTYIKRLEKVKAEDVVRVAKKYLKKDNMSVLYVVPGDKSISKPPAVYVENRSGSPALARKMKLPIDEENHSVYQTPDGWKHPLSFTRTPHKINYPMAKIKKIGETTIFYLPDKEIPLVDLSILIKAGSVDVPEDKLGLSALIDKCLIDGGTEQYSPQKIAMLLDEKAIRLSVSVGEEMSVIRISSLKEEFQTAIRILEDILLNPGFDETVLNSAKEQIISGLKRQAGNALSVIEREAMIWHFRGHPYGRDPLKAINTIPHITRNQLKEFVKRYFVPGNMVFSVSGDIEYKDAVNILSSFINKIDGRPSLVRKLPPIPKTPPVLAFINKPGQIQSQIRILMNGLKRTEPDYWRLGFLVDLLGGEDSLIYNRLREDLGIAYATWFYQTYKWEAGIIKGYIGCKPSMTTDAIEETIRIINQLRGEIPPEKVEDKRLDILNGFVFNVDTPHELVNTYAGYYLRNEPLNTLERIQDIYLKINAQELKEIAKKYLNPSCIQIFIVADGAIRVKKGDKFLSLKEDIKSISKKLNIPFQEIPLR